jgi:hypothetical protein
MGCDIHAYLEEQSADLSKWNEVCQLYYCKRSYNLFGLLAGVRTPIVPIVSLRGIPDDVSPSVSREYKEWGIDAHSSTWYKVEELLQFKGPVIEDDAHDSFNFGYEKGYVQYYQKDILDSLEAFNNEIKKHVGSKNNSLFRVVMWFDN